MRRKRLLVAYSMSSTFVQTTLDYLKALKGCDGYDVEYLHVTHDAGLGVDLAEYDVVFHNYCSRLCFPGYVAEPYLRALEAFEGLKVLAVQDEYDQTEILRAAIERIGFDVVLTCVPQKALDYVYPRSRFADVRFETVLTGYVSDDFAEGRSAPLPLAERRIVVGYRGRDIGPLYGRLGFDKFEIGRRFKEACAARGVPHDIAMDEASRIYGEAWFDFVGGCRAMLGSESGSNVFDFDGSLKRKLKALEEEKGSPLGYAEFAPFVEAREAEIQMGQISPRVFECALMRTPMVLFRGDYSGAIAPDEHYIAVEKDFSNIDDVLDRLSDLPALEQMSERAYDHLVRSERFRYRTYVGRLARIFDEEIARRGKVPAVSSSAPIEASTDWLDLLTIERPSEAPADAARFRAKAAAPTLRIYESEADRLIGEYRALVERCGQWLEHLQEVYRQERRRLLPEDVSPSVAAAVPERMEAQVLRSTIEGHTAEIERGLADRAARIEAFRSGGPFDAEAAAEQVKGFYERLCLFFPEHDAAYQPALLRFNEEITGLGGRVSEALAAEPFIAGVVQGRRRWWPAVVSALRRKVGSDPRLRAARGLYRAIVRPRDRIT